MKRGLHHEIEQLRQSIEIDREKERCPSSDPRDAHEAGERAKSREKQLSVITANAINGEIAFDDITKGLARLEEVHPSERGRELSLAITHAEDALNRLRRYLGDKPRH